MKNMSETQIRALGTELHEALAHHPRSITSDVAVQRMRESIRETSPRAWWNVLELIKQREGGIQGFVRTL